MPQDQKDPDLEAHTKLDTSPPALSETLPIARHVGEYEILQEIGAGETGVVFKAQHTKVGNIVALKFISREPQILGSENELYVWQALSMARLNHSGIVSIDRIGLQDGRPFYTMDYVEGNNLAERYRDRPAPEKLAAEIVRQLAETVHFAHGSGWLHRNLNPTKVLLMPDGLPRIIGFGLARRLRPSVNSSRKETQLVFTAAGYMSPELALDDVRLMGPAVDVYGLGAILYFLLTCKAPFSGVSKADTVAQLIKGNLVSPRELTSGLSRDLETICLKCLETKTHDRYHSAEALAADLCAFLDGRRITARRIGLLGMIRKCVRRHWM